jgi:hypothetical protein
MKSILSFCVLAIASLPSNVAATQSYIGVFTSSYSDQCLMAPQAGAVTFYVVQQLNTGTTAVRFRIDTSPGFTGALMSFSAPQGTVTGDQYGSFTVNYGSCIYGSVVTVLELHYFFSTPSPTCSFIRTAAHPLAPDGMLDAYDCDGVRHAADWAGTHIQNMFPAPDGYPFTLCPDLAGAGHTGYGCKPVLEPLPVAESTWGAVKALYR